MAKVKGSASAYSKRARPPVKQPVRQPVRQPVKPPVKLPVRRNVQEDNISGRTTTASGDILSRLPGTPLAYGWPSIGGALPYATVPLSQGGDIEYGWWDTAKYNYPVMTTPQGGIPTLSELFTQPPSAGGGGGGGGGEAAGEASVGYQPPDVNWVQGTYQAAGQNAPSWWQPFVPQDMSQMNRPDVAFTMMANALIPYMSPEDQARLANSLYTMWGQNMGAYAPGAVGPGEPWEERDFAFMEGRATPDTSYYMGGQRGQEALTTLGSMMQSTAGSEQWKLGPGYNWLQSLLTGISETGGGRTRSSYMDMLSRADPLLAQAKSGDLGAFGPLGQMLTKPYFGRFNLRPTTQAGTFGRERGSKYLYW